jgi:hypothetical protein
MSQSQLELIDTYFKLPITYNKYVKKLHDNVVIDLELSKNILENSNKLDIENNIEEKEELQTKCLENDEINKPIYDYILKPKTAVGKKMIEIIPQYYTTDVEYLSQTQTLLKTISNNQLSKISEEHEVDKFSLEDFLNTWNEIKGENGFCEKYLYIDWSFAKFMNNNATFLQCMSLYNIVSPIISLCIPIFVLIVPFIIIKIKKLEVSLTEYITILKSIISQHAISQIFTNFSNVNFGQKLYLLVSAAFYLFSIYQNILICIRFYSNMKKINDYLLKFKKYLNYSLSTMKYWLDISITFNAYNNFNTELQKHMLVLEDLQSNLLYIQTFNISLAKISQIGHIMKIFYKIYDDETYNQTILYSLGFNGYMDILNGIKTNIDNNNINVASYQTDINNKPTFKKMYYPKFVDENNKIVNDCDLTKNIIITGPNASGKTTTLKTTIINIIISQQFGYGCFEQLTFRPYDNIHCYLNIPDTSGRDSLFQAEARRCKYIIDCIKDKKDETHFCIFDELYSGTNPDEAVVSANAFMEYIVKHKNITCLLTTHYIKLCKKLSKNKNIKNYNMKTIKSENGFEYTYKLNIGISKVKGGIKVLSDMNYPKEILEKTSML